MSVDRALNHPPAVLQLLLFLDERMTSCVQNQEIRIELARLNRERAFDLQVVDVSKQPDLAEHYKVIVTPALVKLYPPPRQTLAGRKLIHQIDNWWERWQGDLAAVEGVTKHDEEFSGAIYASNRSAEPVMTSESIGYVSKLIRLTDEVFTLKQEKEQLLNRLKLQDRAISVLAHDLRNPLTAAALALGTLEIIHNPDDYRANALEPAKIEQLINRARRQLQSIERLVADILQPLATANAELTLNLQQLDLTTLITGVVDRLDERFQLKSQTLTTDIPQDLPPVYGDADKLTQLVINLLDNAIKYTPDRGRIHVSALHRTAQTIQVSIADNGLGIPAAECKRIFQERYRLDRDALESGYGIGLAVCQQIVRAHYGQIWAESEPGKGSVFNFTLMVDR